MNSKRIEGLPFQPGNSFIDPTLSDFRKNNTFSYKNGFFQSKDDYLGIGQCPIPAKALSVKDLFEMYSYDPILTYGVPRPKAPKPVVPTFVLLEKKTLKFTGYYKETVNDSPSEIYRVRHVNIYYYLEDDTIMVDEPNIDNSGLMQGKLIKRHRIPKNDLGEYWHWKDLNVKCEVMFYGRVFRITDCDKWTMDFYESEGVIMNDPELAPNDPYIEKRFQAQKKRTFCTPNVMDDRMKKIMEFGGKVLRFYCVWDDRDSEYGSLRRFDLYYHLQDDTVEVAEMHANNDGRDPFKLLLHKTRLPKNWADLPLTFPVVSLEATIHEVVEYYEPKDFKIGATINVFGRRFLIYDMDKCTQQYYRDHFGYTDFTPVCIENPKAPRIKPPYPPYNGWGAPEDSLQSCLRIVPKRPRYDAMKRLIFELKVLKFGATMDSTRPEDIGREFTVSYRLVDDKLAVYERPVRNSGWPGGKFLDYLRVQRPGSSNDDPDYYGPHDLYIGAVIEVFNTRFCLVSADQFVLEFIKANPDCFPEHVKDNLMKYFECEKVVNPKLFQEKPCDPGREVCEEPIGEGFFEHLGLGIQRQHQDPCHENPNPCPMYYDWDMCRKLGYNCGQQRPNLPFGCDRGAVGDYREVQEDPIDKLCEMPCPGNPDMFEAKDMAVCQPERYLPPDPPLPNPRLTEDPACIPPDRYDYLKDHRFDCYNPPDADKQFEIYEKQRKFFCPCPEDECGEKKKPEEPNCPE